jgi:hypothetical protein
MSRERHGLALVLGTLCQLGCEARDSTQVTGSNRAAPIPTNPSQPAPQDGGIGREPVAQEDGTVDAGQPADGGCDGASDGAGEPVSVHVTWSELFQTPSCSFFSTPQSEATRVFALGEQGSLSRRGAEIWLELGESSFVWDGAAFRRQLECPYGGRAWRFSESMHGSWWSTEPLDTCASPAVWFTGSYHYEECVVLPSGACGLMFDACSQFAVIEISLGEADPSASTAGEPGNPCGPIRERCGGTPCKRDGEACADHDECELGSVCTADACEAARTCRALEDCPESAERVCACDGHDYASACEARFSGQSIDHPGSCVPSVEPPIFPEGAVDVPIIPIDTPLVDPPVQVDAGAGG